MSINRPDKIILHHSLTKDGKVVDWTAIKKYHIETNGWKDIGYQYGVELVGDKYEIMKGRSEDEEGAHTKGQNTKSIGICLVGNFDLAPPPQKQLEKLYELLEEIFSRRGKLPIYGHNHYSSKTCPGTKFQMAEVLTQMFAPKHWAEKPYNSLIKKGFVIHEKRFDDRITRGEVFALLDQLIDRMVE